MQMMNTALSQFRSETNLEVQSLGAHIKKLEAALPEKDQYQFSGLAGGTTSGADLFEAAGVSPLASESSKGSMNMGPGQMGTLAANTSALNLTCARMQQILHKVQGTGNGLGDDPYKPPPVDHTANLYRTIVKGGNKKTGPKLLWSENDNAMCWGLIPIWRDGNGKYALEIVTLGMVVTSVVVIVIQSYDKYNPDKCSNRPGDIDLSNADLLALLRSDTDATTTAPGSGLQSELCEVVAEQELFYLQLFLIGWFSIEYVIRWAAVRPDSDVRRPYTAKQFWMAKLKYTFSFMSLVDLCSILPVYTGSIAGSDGGGNGGAFLIFRVLRIIRIFKITRHNRTLTDVVAALQGISSDLFVFFVVILTLVVLTATIMFYVEMGNPEGWFTSIPECMYWTIITFTSVGYGDRYPVSDGGRVVAAITSLVGTILMNFPIALIILSFDEVYKVRKGREERASMIVNRLFTWSNRHRGKQELIYGPTSIKSQVSIHKSRSLTRFLGKKSKVGPSLAHFKKTQKLAKKRLLDMILHPQHQHRKVGNGAYNSRDHYLTSKYSTKWTKATAQGRKRRQQELTAIATQIRKEVMFAPQSNARKPVSTQAGTFKKRRSISKSAKRVFSKAKIVPISSKISAESYHDV
jgi:hypothetical protein